MPKKDEFATELSTGPSSPLVDTVLVPVPTLDELIAQMTDVVRYTGSDAKYVAMRVRARLEELRKGP